MLLVRVFPSAEPKEAKSISTRRLISVDQPRKLSQDRPEKELFVEAASLQCVRLEICKRMGNPRNVALHCRPHLHLRYIYARVFAAKKNADAAYAAARPMHNVEHTRWRISPH